MQILRFQDKFTFLLFISYCCIIGFEGYEWDYLDNDNIAVKSYAQSWRN
jgi:hypothetical protein